MAEEKSQKRGGSTVVTSVSVSDEFQKLISQYNLSPTECFRRGVAVTLFDLGVGMYQGTKNEERSKFMHEFLQKISDDEKQKEMEKDVAEIEEALKELKTIKAKLSNKILRWME